MLGERVSVARTLLEDVDALLRQASARPADLDALAVGTGPGSFTSTRIGLAVARGLGARARRAGRRRLDARRARAQARGTRRSPVIDARRGEVFVPGPRAVAPAELDARRPALRRRRRRALPRRCSRRTGRSSRRTTTRGTVPRASLHAAPRDGVRARRRDRAAVRARAGCEPMAAVKLELRRLELADLDAIEQIERVSYRTPWSRSMFASELAKPSSLSLGAVDEDGALVGYLVLSRYVDAWHVMNVAVAPAQRRSGVASALLERLLDVTRDEAQRGYTLEVRVSNVGAITPLRAVRLHGARRPARLLHGQPRGRADHVARRRSRARRRRVSGARPRPRDVLRRDGRRRRHRGRRACSPRSSPRRPSSTRGTAASCRRSPRDGTWSSSRRSLRAALDDAGRSLDDVGRVAVTQGPGLVGALLVGLSAAKALAWARGLPLVPVDHLRAHVATLYLEPEPLEPPFTCLLASGGHTLLLSVVEPVGLRGARRDARRRRRRGVRQGRAAARARLPGRRRDRPARPRRRSRGLRVPRRPRARPRLLVLRAEDRPPLRGARARRGRARAPPGRPGRLVPARDRPGARRTAAPPPPSRPATRRSRSWAASRRTPSCARRCRTRGSRRSPLCTDNAAMVASAGRFAAPVPLPGYLGLDAYASSPSL